MVKNPWFTLVLGLLVGLAVGYALAERQAVPPAAAGTAAVNAGLPEGHPPMTGDGAAIAAQQRLRQQASELEGLLAQNPGDYRLMVQLANLYYDAEQWPAARMWYERALEVEHGDPNVITDLAVVYRALGEFDHALERLREANTLAPEHWQSVYNQIVILHFDLHRHDEARVALDKLKGLKATNPQIPDLSGLESEVLGHQHN